MQKTNNNASMPIAITLEPGSYERCTCGASQNLPFCDGGHRGENRPIRFEITERRKVFLCSCGQTSTQPFCDQSCGVDLDRA